MIALDSNLLVYAHRQESPWYEAACGCLRALIEGRAPWAIPWPCVHEFLAVVTHPTLYDPPSPIATALAEVDEWIRCPSLVLLPEGADHWRQLRRAVEAGKIVGGMVHDARLVAICVAHGIREFWTADRDFGRFPEFRVRNPLVSPA